MVTLIIWGNDENGYWEKRGTVYRSEIDNLLNQYDYEGYEVE